MTGPGILWLPAMIGKPGPADRQLVPMAGPDRLRRIGMSHRFVAPAGTLDWTDGPAFRVPAPGTLELINARIQAGPAGTLHLRPMIRRRGAGPEQEQYDLITYVGTLSYLNGNGIDREFDVSEPLYGPAADEWLWIRYRNLDLVNDREVTVDMEIDYAYGPWPRWAIAPGVLQA